MQLADLLAFLNTCVVLGSAFGGLWVFRGAFKRSKKAETVDIQSETITALQQRQDLLEKDLNMLREENARLRQTIETIQIALGTKGIKITIDGEMILIEEKPAAPNRKTQVTTVKRVSSRKAPQSEEKK